MKVKDNLKCEGCPLAKLFPDNNFVPPTMGPSLRLVIGEAPGEDESIQMKPFVGGSGRVLDMLLRKAGIQRESLTVLNTLQCRPKENIYPTDPAARGYIQIKDGEEAVRHCYREYVRPVLESRPWNRVDIVGAKALRLLTGTADITKWRGSPVEIDTEEIDKRMGVK